MKQRRRVVFICIFIILLAVILLLLEYFNLLPKKTYTNADFGIETVYSSVDYNDNGIDDYKDIMLGARKDAQNHPKYDPAYIDGGYPADNKGVCSDVVWRAFKNAGYCLKDMVDNDIEKRLDDYSDVTAPDKNIDFRRVKNLRVFFEEYAIELTTDIDDISQWQAGDIVIFGNDKHIGIISDKRNKNGQPYVIHNGGQPNREEDYLPKSKVTGHYRFDASKVNEEILKEWK
ncbi:MAG: DUF1287 domain-containing protein [Acutalibacteraceae bacterium]|nr:DUF1287 domain-containing protein [Acutalibacteraceae bacterium]